jgi:hypothetical protein
VHRECTCYTIVSSINFKEYLPYALYMKLNFVSSGQFANIPEVQAPIPPPPPTADQDKVVALVRPTLFSSLEIVSLLFHCIFVGVCTA